MERYIEHWPNKNLDVHQTNNEKQNFAIFPPSVSCIIKLLKTSKIINIMMTLLLSSSLFCLPSVPFQNFQRKPLASRAYSVEIWACITFRVKVTMRTLSNYRRYCSRSNFVWFLVLYLKDRTIFIILVQLWTLQLSLKFGSCSKQLSFVYKFFITIIAT